MSDVQSTVAGLKAQDCPGGGWTGMPADLEGATVADCLAHGVCGCIYGDAVQHIERLQADMKRALSWLHRNANAEQEPKARAAFIEAHNAVLKIVENVPPTTDSNVPQRGPAGSKG